jgi:hypothetical protein
MSTESDGILTLRAMAWERSKGELQAFLATFWPEYGRNGVVTNPNHFDEIDAAVQKLVKEVEDYL